MAFHIQPFGGNRDAEMIPIEEQMADGNMEVLEKAVIGKRGVCIFQEQKYRVIVARFSV